MLLIIGVFIAHWYLSLFCQTFFLHRYASHKMFRMSPFWEKFFFVFTWICQGASYLSPYAYGALHRMHHAYADTEEDPHSPSYDENMFAMMWRTRTVYNDILRGRMTLEDRFTNGLPNWTSFDTFGNHFISRVFWSLGYIAFYMLFATAWWMYLLIPIHILMGPVHGVVINWFAHKYGYVNFKTNDTSKNFLPFDFLMLGESYHNNHHTRALNPNFGGVRWHELDLTYPVIKMLAVLGVIRLVKN